MAAPLAALWSPTRTEKLTEDQESDQESAKLTSICSNSCSNTILRVWTPKSLDSRRLITLRLLCLGYTGGDKGQCETRETPNFAQARKLRDHARAEEAANMNGDHMEAESRDFLRDAPGEHADGELDGYVAWRSKFIGSLQVMLP